MDSHVAIQVPRLTKSEETQFTLVGLFPGVDPQVLGEGGRVAESFFAHPAAVGTLAGVRAHVRGDRRRLGEAAVADGTPEGLFAAVCPHVRRQVGRLAEGFVALVAPVGLFPAVCSEVRLQSGRAGVRLAADPAEVGLKAVAHHGFGHVQGTGDARHPDGAGSPAERAQGRGELAAGWRGVGVWSTRGSRARSQRR